MQDEDIMSFNELPIIQRLEVYRRLNMEYNQQIILEKSVQDTHMHIAPEISISQYRGALKLNGLLRHE